MLFGGAAHQLAGKFALVADVAVHLAAFQAIERRLRDVDVIFFNELAHVTEEKCEQQRADVAAVHVSVGHQNDFVIAQLGGVEIVFANAGAERGDNQAQLFVAEHLVVTGLLDVQDFAFEQQNGLIFAIAAFFGRAAGGGPLDDEKLAAGGIAFLAIGEFSRQAARIERRFAARQFAGFAGGFAGARGVNTLADDFSRDGGMLVEILAELFIHELLDESFDVAVEFSFGLAFELRLRQLHGNDGDQAFANIVAGDGNFVLLLFEHAVGARVIVDGARERGAEAGKMRAAVNGVDGVGKAKNIFRVAVVVLQRDFHFDSVALAFDVNGGIVEDGFAAIEMLDEFGDAAGEAKFRFFAVALVLESDFEAFVQEGQFAQALRKRVETQLDGGKNRGIRMKSDFRSGLFGFAGVFQFGSGMAFFVALLPDLAFAPDFQIEPVGEGVYDGNTDAVQAAGDFIRLAVEFSASVQDSHDDFGSRLLFSGVHVHRNAAAVVDDGDRVVFVDHDVDFVAVAGHGFIDGIVGNFPDEVVQTEFACGTDVHGGAFANRFQSAEDFDGRSVVLVPCGLRRRVFFFTHSGELLVFESGKAVARKV